MLYLNKIGCSKLIILFLFFVRPRDLTLNKRVKEKKKEAENIEEDVEIEEIEGDKGSEELLASDNEDVDIFVDISI